MPNVPGMPPTSSEIAPAPHISTSVIIGVISDTHGLLRSEALAALASANHILHAGDIGDMRVVETLRQLAPVTAIRDNIDTSGPCTQFPVTELVEVTGRLFYLVHSVADLDISPSAAGVAAVISGHSHKPAQDTRNGVLYFNPGSAGPRRFNLPVTIGLLTVTPAALTARIIPIL